MANKDEKGYPIKIVEIKQDRSLKLNIEGLHKVLLRSDIKNMPVVVVSIVGDFRKGKSFILNFFIQYLQSSENNENWIQDLSLTYGFTWRKGTEPETTGWIMWSEPFIKKLSNGKNVAVILIDSQGAKDHASPVQDCVQLFALSTLVSSIQIINQRSNLQESDFDELGLFMDYGLVVLSDNNEERPFQKLLFLVRDWDPSDGIEFGFEAGNALFEKKMQIKDGQTQEMLRIRKSIRACFNQINCYLMHHPGLKMTENENFNGELQYIRPEFIEDVQTFVPSLLHSSNLVVKRIGNRDVTGKDLYDYIILYFEQFSSGNMPKVESITILVRKSSILFAKNKAINYYTLKMDKITVGSGYVKGLIQENNKITAEALKIFDETRILGCNEFKSICREELKEELRNLFDSYNIKNIQNKTSCACFK